MLSMRNHQKGDYRVRGAPQYKRSRSQIPSFEIDRIRSRLLIVSITVIVTVVAFWWGGSQLWQVGMRWLSGTSWAIMDRIEVKGLVRLPEHDIITAAAVPDSSNLLKLNLDSVSARVTKLPGIKGVRTVARLPGRLVIRVEERIPIAAVGIGELVLIDDQKAAFPPEYGGEVLDVPIITGKMKINRNDPDFDLASSIIIRIKEDYPSVYDHLSEMHLIDGTVEMRLRQGGALIKSIDMENLENLDLFLSQKGESLPTNIDYVDMRFPTMVITGTKG